MLARDGKLNGRALFVLDYGADFYLVGSNERELYLVAAAAQGIEGRGLTTVDGSRHLGELTFADTPAEPLALTPEQVQNVLDWGRVALAADSLGAAQCMLDQAVAYAKQREQFDRVIASFQAVKHMCAEMAAGLEPCRAMLLVRRPRPGRRTARSPPLCMPHEGPCQRGNPVRRPHGHRGAWRYGLY